MATERRWFLLLGLLATVGALGSEVGRLVFKGQEYAYGSFNDIHFYTAMVFNLWGEPISVGQELADLGFVLTADEWRSFYGGEDSFWSTHVHSENGLSHQAPWAYRVFVPTAAAALRFIGIPLEVAFLVIFVASAVLLALSTFKLLGPYVREVWWAALVALGVVTAALAFTSPGYPDMTFLGFAMLAVLFAYRQKGLSFALAGFAAGLTRETAVLLVLSWLILTWSSGKLNWKSAIYAFGPMIGVLVARFLVPVPNASTDYLGMLRDVSQWPETLAWSLVVVAVVGLISPLVLGRNQPASGKRVVPAEFTLWVLGAVFVLGSGLLNLASSRMALLALPLLMAPVAWSRARSHLWLAAALAATLGYAFADTLAFRADPVFGPWPWVAVGISVVALQLLAVRRDQKALGEQRLKTVGSSLE